MGTINEETGKRLRHARVAAKMSCPALAKKVGLSADIIYQLETGKRCLKANEAEKMAEILGVTASWIAQGVFPRIPAAGNGTAHHDRGEAGPELVASTPAAGSTPAPPEPTMPGKAEEPATSLAASLAPVPAESPKPASPEGNATPAPSESAVPGSAEEPAAPLAASLAPVPAESPKPAPPEGNAAPTPPQSTVPGRAEGPSVPLAVNLESVPVEAPKIAKPEASPEPAPADDHQPTPPKDVKATLRRILIGVLPPFIVTLLRSERRRLRTWITCFCLCGVVFLLYPVVPLRWHALGVAVCGFFVLQMSLRLSALDMEARRARPHDARGSA